LHGKPSNDLHAIILGVDLEAFVRALAGRFNTVRLQLSSGRILLPREPVNLEELARSFADGDQELELLESEYAYNLFLDGHYLPYRSVLDFEYHGFMWTGSQLQLLEPEGLGPTSVSGTMTT
jgi:hypothetical protein